MIDLITLFLSGQKNQNELRLVVAGTWDQSSCRCAEFKPPLSLAVEGRRIEGRNPGSLYDFEVLSYENVQCSCLPGAL